MIIISRKALRDPKHKRDFVASICQAMHQFLSGGKPISIEVRGEVTLSDAAEALRNIAEILGSAGSITKDDKTDDKDADSADWWKAKEEEDD